MSGNHGIAVPQPENNHKFNLL